MFFPDLGAGRQPSRRQKDGRRTNCTMACFSRFESRQGNCRVIERQLPRKLYDGGAAKQRRFFTIPLTKARAGRTSNPRLSFSNDSRMNAFYRISLTCILAAPCCVPISRSFDMRRPCRLCRILSPHLSYRLMMRSQVSSF